MTTVEILRQARDRYGAAPSHAPFGEACPVGTYCAAMAIGMDMTSGTQQGERALAAAAGLNEDGAGHGFRLSVIRWNEFATTAEVLAAFDRAIQNEEAREAEFTVTPAEPVEDREHVAVV